MSDPTIPPRPGGGPPVDRPGRLGQPLGGAGTPPALDSPFGPASAVDLDPARADRVLAMLAQRHTELGQARATLAKLRFGIGRDGEQPSWPVLTRAEGQWPFLLIRSFPGDYGQRPDPRAGQSPDIVLTDTRPDDTPVVDRSGMRAVLDRSVGTHVAFGSAYTVWVHVWNLGRRQATGVRVRIHRESGATANLPGFPEIFLGGTAFDLGDRLSERAHLLVRALVLTSWSPQIGIGASLRATVDTFDDPVPTGATAATDRHMAHRSFSTRPPRPDGLILIGP